MGWDVGAAAGAGAVVMLAFVLARRRLTRDRRFRLTVVLERDRDDRAEKLSGDNDRP